MRVFKTLFIVLMVIPVFASCASVSPSSLNDENITVAKVQKEIKVGMYSSDVIEILGSPNIITTDSLRRETWVYDKVATHVQASTSSTGVWILIFGGSSNSSSYASQQRTLTIIIKFDEHSMVRDFAYRTSSF